MLVPPQPLATAECRKAHSGKARSLRFQCEKIGDTQKHTSVIAKNGVEVFFSAPCFYRRELKSLLCK